MQIHAQALRTTAVSYSHLGYLAAHNDPFDRGTSVTTSIRGNVPGVTLILLGAVALTLGAVGLVKWRHARVAGLTLGLLLLVGGFAVCAFGLDSPG